MTNYYLAHHGILGMKWGKKNGPPYPLENSQRSAAERKVNKESESSKKQTSHRENIKNATTDATTLVNNITKLIPRKNKVDLSKYSDSELQQIVNRQRLEQQYNQLNPDSIDRGANFTKEVIQTAGATAGLVLTYKMIKKG